MGSVAGDEDSGWTHGRSSGAWRANRPPTSAVPWTPGREEASGTATCKRCAADSLRTFLLPDIAERVQVTGPEDAAALLVPELIGRGRERRVAALLDTKHRLLAVATVSVGSVDHTFMSPREVLRDALLANASALVLAHNHPSGDPEPSRDDELVTRRLVHGGEVVGVPVLDHLVVGGSRWVSLARRGLV